MSAEIALSHLGKVFGTVRAVDDISFTAHPGTVTAVLGPNGAGKTTTLRMILGLVTPTEGTATVHGVPYADLPRPVESVGAVLEATAFHPGLTGRDHLEAIRIAAGLRRARVDAVLDQVDLTAAAGRKVRGYSLGMRQRLAIATALLGDPRILVLDEPSNGLDPAGVHWLRGFLRAHAHDGKTVLVSTHVLAETQRYADRALFVSGGRIVRETDITPATDLEAIYLEANR
ncbi:ATP-binding cassette domain-containing protein [Spongiactinospora sp. TRM90649]|uniref:ABC transporter ATP-binding protein n=1 Tax=Spongiactinospora sp. TRM90649 TaxID=3031114 RepID=UPI0023F6AE18|nr:ATP-binding cassette domain-containing protein [Spongiactinospora sp. TRM90649]MDF5757167.1 ATP-binding cassette domain-containing protein [Spongiactinospora sp. TRM90649]